MAQRHATMAEPPLQPPRRAQPGDDDDDDDIHTPFWSRPGGLNIRHEKKRYFIVTLMLAVWLTFTVLMTINAVKLENVHHSVVSVAENGSRSLWLDKPIIDRQILTELKGPFLKPFKDPDEMTRELVVILEKVTFKNAPPENLYTTDPGDILETQEISNEWKLYLLPRHTADLQVMMQYQSLMEVYPDVSIDDEKDKVRILLKSTLEGGVAVLIDYEMHPIQEVPGVATAIALLMGLYIIVGFELVHRALASLIAAMLAIAALAVFGQRPELMQVIEWIDMETMLLLFSMMVMVAILTKTGVFDWLSVIAFKITRGNLWPMIFTLCIFAGIASSIIDVVTTVLLMTPVAIRITESQIKYLAICGDLILICYKLCEMLKLNPKPVLLAIIFSANIISSLTPVGDPPNIILSNHPDVKLAGVDFGTFVLHMFPCVLVATLVLFLQLRYCFYRHATKMQAEEPTGHEITVWQRTASMLSLYTRDEHEVSKALNSQVKRLRAARRDSDVSTVTTMTMQSEVVAHHEHPNSASFEYLVILRDMRQKYPIRDKVLLLKCCIALSFAMFFFFIGHSAKAINLSLGTVAFLAALLLLIMADKEDLDGVLARVEWATLVFFAGLFIFMECLQLLGLMDWLGGHMENAILSVDKENQLLVALMLVLWMSAFCSALMDSVPLMTMMVKIAVRLSQTPALLLPLQPMVWALAFGCCFGGSGTLIGSAANVVCTGVAEQHGYKITMWQFSKIGMPVMIVSVMIASTYLIICHVVFTWH